MVDNTHHTTRIKTVGRGFSPTSALKTPQCIDVANNKGAGFKDFVGLKTDLHHHVPRTTHQTVGRPFMATSSNRQYTFPTRVGRGFSPTSALKTPQCIDITKTTKALDSKILSA